MERPAILTLYKAVFDEKFPESVAFAGEMRRLGVSTDGIAGDMTGLWYSDFHPQWTKKPAAIAGLTAYGPLFCLERLAWDHGMRVVFRGEHRYRPDACIEHVISAPPPALRDTDALRAAGSNWSAQVARLAIRSGPGRLETSPVIVTPAAGVSARNENEPLFSWVIAPRARS
jgi:hypothetical protein